MDDRNVKNPQSNFNSESNFFNNSDSSLSLKNKTGQYIFNVDISQNNSIEDLDYNGEALCKAGRYEEAVQCYSNALAKIDMPGNSDWKFDKWKLLVNYSVPLTNLGRHAEALFVLKEALNNLENTQRMDYSGWIVEERIKSIRQTMEKIPSSQSNMTYK